MTEDRARGAWVLRGWGKRWPSIESAEGPVHTVAIPFPVATETTWDGNKYFTALVVVLPWYPCKCMDEAES